MNRPFFASLLAAFLLLSNGLGLAQSKLTLLIRDDAFQCKNIRQCEYFSDFLKRSPIFKQSLLTAIKKSDVNVHPSVYQGPSSPMTPVKIEGVDALIGSTCEKNDCTHTLIVIVYSDDFAFRTTGLYVDRSGGEKSLGHLTAAEKVAVYKSGEYSVGERFDPPGIAAVRTSVPSTRIDVEELNKLAAVGMPTGKNYAVKAYITGVNIGMALLCSRSMGYGACDSRDPQTRVYPELDRSLEGKLYDVRGTSGARICALVSMWNDGKIHLLDFRPDDCPSSW